MKFSTSLLSYFLKIGLTDVCLAFSEKTFIYVIIDNMSLLIMLAIWQTITFAEIFTIFGGILSGLVAFLGSNVFIILFISSFAARGVSKVLFLSATYLLLKHLDSFSNAQ